MKLAPSKAETALLEPFTGLPLDCIHQPETEADCTAAMQEIIKAGYAGFDTESRPVFDVGTVSQGPHVVQFALRSKAFLFQLYWPACHQPLRELLHSPEVMKIGFDLKSDTQSIRMKLGVEARGMLDLDHVFRKDGYPKSMGVRAAVGAVLHQRFHKSKKTTTSNWALARLSEKQRLYAANDAYAALRVYEALDI